MRLARAWAMSAFDRLRKSGRAATSSNVISAYEIANQLSDELEVWIEPWCHPYRVPRGSILKLTYAASTEYPLHTEVTPERIVVWTNSDREPSAELDGRAVAPDFS